MKERNMRSSSLGFAAIIGKVVKGIIALFAVAFILIFLLAWLLNNRSDEQTKYHQVIEPLEIQVLNEYSEYVYFVEPQYDEDGVHMCSVYFRKNAFTDSDEYTKQEVTEGIQDIVVKYIEENEGLFAPDFKIELWDVQNYSWNGSPNLCQVVWTISINEGEICVMTPINAS